ncbi:hypothetical protein [Ruthenibacterium lactatiformans]|uniref:hypothetical protein n=1 Tax=Ruthenibacterium lactatiformans TaxID=1550024 RepID=UPI0039A2726D
MQYGFVKTAALTPSIRVADCAYNARQIIEVLRGAAAAGAEIACLPELCITGPAGTCLTGAAGGHN